jgi:hypothetical protein
MNVGLMHGPPRVVERALEAAAQVRRRRRRRRAVVGALVVTAAVGTLAGVAAATRDDGPGITVTAGSSTTQSSPPTTATLPDPSALIGHWNTDCGPVPGLAPVSGLRFTIDLQSPVVAPGGGTPAELRFENTTGKEILVGTGVGAWFVTTPDGRLVGTSLGYPVITIGYMFTVAAQQSTVPSEPRGGVGSVVGACTKSAATADQTPPLPRGRYLAWFGIPTDAGAMFISEPARFEVAGAPLWDVTMTRAQALAIGRENAIDPETAIVTAKLASWAEIRSAGGVTSTGPNENPDRRVWVVSISGEVRSRCCLMKHEPFRWGIVFVDARDGDRFSSIQHWKGDIAPWFADLPDHGA